MTESLDVTPKTTEQNLIVRIGKSEAEVTNNKICVQGICDVYVGGKVRVLEFIRFFYLEHHGSK